MNQMQCDMLVDICRNPTVHTGTSNWLEVCAYIDGIHATSGCLIGFREWLVTRLEHGNNVAWFGLVRLALCDDGEPNLQTIARMGELFAEFHEATKSPSHHVSNGLMRVFLRYHAYLLRQSWYEPGWTGGESEEYIPPYDGCDTKPPPDSGE